MNILITGSAKRIGKAVADYLAKQGHNIAIHYHSSEQEAEDLRDRLEGYGSKVTLIQANLADEHQTSTLIQKASDGLQAPIDVLINNASVFGNDSIESMTRQSWDTHIETNLRAPLVLSQALAKQLPEGQNGNIINMLDYCVWNLPKTFLSYTVSKSALWTLTQTLALQLAPRIRVNAIGPGHSLPNSRESEANFQAAQAKTPLKNGASPEAIAEAISFILSADTMTGQMLALDGGKHLQGANFY